MAHPETLLISAVLRTGNYKATVSTGITPGMFIAFPDEWSYIHTYYNKHGKVPGKESFKERFPEFILFRVDDVVVHAEDVKQEYARHAVTLLIDDAIDSIQKGDIDKAMGKLGTELLRTQAVLADQENDYNVSSDYQRTLKIVEDRMVRQQSTGWAGTPTGLGTLDMATGGIQPGWLGIIGGRLGEGKTWVMARMACEAAYRGFSALFYSLEQSQDEIAMRTHTLLSKMLGSMVFRTSDLQRGFGLDMIEYQRFLSGLEDALEGRLVINDSSRGRVSPMTVAAAIEREQPDIVFIDYLTLMSMKGEGDWRSVGELSASLKQLAIRYRIPIMAGSQLNRQAVRDSTPDASTISRSDEVGQNADLVMTIAKKSKSVRMISLAKFRHGSDGQMFFIKWKPNIGEIEEISGDEAATLIDDDKQAD